MQTKLRLELFIERMALKRACNVLEAAGVSGYTVLPAMSGFGGRVRWRRDTDISAAQDMVVLICIGDQAQFDVAMEQLQALLDDHVGVLSLGEVRVMRPELF